MRIACLQHVPFEGPAAIARWAESKGHPIALHHLYDNQPLPDPGAFDLLLVMGGPMNVDQDDKYPWLAGEKDFIRRCLEADTPMLGICLGAQLMARALDAAVVPGLHKEIGFHEVQKGGGARESVLFRDFPETLTVFQWHGDTFAIPEGARRLFRSKGCTNQGFIHNRAVALQFHLETTRDTMEALIANCREEIVAGDEFVQEPRVMRAGADALDELNRLCFALMGRMEKMLQARPEEFRTARPPSC